MAIQKLKSPFHANHAKHSADFICEIVDEKRVLRKAIEAKDKTIEAQAKEIAELKKKIDAYDRSRHCSLLR